MQAVFLNHIRPLVRFFIIVLASGLFLLLICSLRYPSLPKVMVYQVFRDYSRISMSWKTRYWQEIEGDNFILRFRPGDENVAGMVLRTAEEAYAPVNKALRYRPPGKILIILYPDTLSLNRSFGWAADESAMGVYWAGVIRILSPNYWIEGADKQERFQAEGPMAHEYAHYLVDCLAEGNYPRWFTEGVAQQVERKVTGFEIPLTGPEQIYSLSEMDKSFDLLENQSAAYRQSLAMVDFLVERYGDDALTTILEELGKGKTMDGAFREATGKNVGDFEQDFLQSIR